MLRTSRRDIENSSRGRMDMSASAQGLTLANASRELLPKPAAGADERSLSGCSPNPLRRLDTAQALLGEDEEGRLLLMLLLREPLMFGWLPAGGRRRAEVVAGAAGGGWRRMLVLFQQVLRLSFAASPGRLKRSPVGGRRQPTPALDVLFAGLSGAPRAQAG